MVSVSDIASGSAIVFSGVSLWNTSLRAANLEAFVPPMIRYASPYQASISETQSSVFEVFEIPVTLINSGARTGTVLSVDLTVADPQRRVQKRFYSACTGSWHREKTVYKPFAPMSLAGRTSESETLLFFPRSDETVPLIVENAGRFRFSLSLNMAGARAPGLLTRLFGGAAPAPVNFEMTLPMLDHRSFTFGSGTVTLNQPDWKATGSGG